MGIRRLSSRLVVSGLCGALLMSNLNASETVVYSQGFESNSGSYTHTGVFDTWQWGTPSASSAYGPKAAHSGTKCWGTMLCDTVPFSANAYLTSPRILLPALGANQVMRVRFFAWIAVDLMSDRGEFQVSSDSGVTWETKAELFCTMQGGWNEYDYDISDHGGDTVLLRFRCITDDQNTFDPGDGISYNMAGLYVDDIAITVTDAPSSRKILTFEGSEDQSSYASCPWIFVQGKNGVYQQENDIYSTARGISKVYTDFYRLNTGLSAKNNNKYVFKIKETDQEESYTDLLHLILVDHSASVDAVCDENGNAFTYKSNQADAPSAAVDKNGKNVLSLIQSQDDVGCKAYNGDYFDLDFSAIGNPKDPIFLLQAKGFVTDTMPGSPISVQPKIEVQTQNSSGQWQTRNVFYPRWNFALNGYDMAGLFPYSKKIRLLSSSCLTGKYNLIDWAAVYGKTQKSITLTELTPDSAIRSDGNNLAPALSAIDGGYAHMGPSEEIVLTFTPPSNANGNKRDFIVKSRGYYNPMGTFFFYTWDGSKWTQRDGWTVPSGGDQTRQFDLSLWLPDPTGANRVRIWQDYIYYPASIDYVGLRRDSVDLIMNSATDLHYNSSVLNQLNGSDGQKLSWDYGDDDGWPKRDRWVEIAWSDTFVNTPPSTNPVYITNTNSPTPTINWTYHDIDGNPQNQYEVEVWSGPNGTGAILWDPPVGYDAALSVVYAGQPLTSGQKYWARVKAFDSLSWGAWSEDSFIVSANHPPAAEAGPDKAVFASLSCLTSVQLDGSASYDIDGDTLSYMWTGAFGAAAGVKPAVYLYPGSYLVRLIVSDGKGGSGVDSVTVTIRDTIAPVPDSASLPTITGECLVALTTPPTATDNCAGRIVGTTDSLLFTNPGTHVITWCYYGGNGNISMQRQTIVISDHTAPVPDLATLPALTGQCFVAITNYPTATDNCSGQIVGETTDPLSYSQQGTYTITWKYQDANGNVSTQPQLVTVVDNTAPLPDVPSLPAISGSCSVTITQFPTATDNCKGTILGTTAGPLTYTTKGTYTISWRYDDGNGNVATQTQSVVVLDTSAPAPDVAQLPVIQGNCCVSVCTKPTATDNCKGKIIGATTNPLTYTTKGAYTITWRYDDGNGNVATQTQSVIVLDTTPPTPSVSQLPIVQGNCKVSICSKPTATDNCKGRITATTCDPLVYTKKGTYTIHWTYSDGNGNTSGQTQTVIVNDNTAPMPNVNTLPAITGYICGCHCYTVCSYPTATDNCKGKIVATTSSPLTFCHKGNFTIAWKYNDGNGNVTTQNQTVYIR